MVIATETGSP